MFVCLRCQTYTLHLLLPFSLLLHSCVTTCVPTCVCVCAHCVCRRLVVCLLVRCTLPLRRCSSLGVAQGVAASLWDEEERVLLVSVFVSVLLLLVLFRLSNVGWHTCQVLVGDGLKGDC